MERSAPRQMLRKLTLWLLLFLVLLSVKPASAQEGERFEMLQIGSVTYSNVAVMSKTATHLVFTHSMGLCSLKLSDLDQTALNDLGYDPQGRAVTRKVVAPDLSEIEIDPRVAEMQGKFAKDLQDKFGAIARNVLLGIGILLVLGYLFFCFCCVLICRKAGVPAPFISWVPGMQVWALMRAAGLPRWSVSALFAPHIFSGMAQYLLPEDITLSSPKMITFIAFAIISVIISLATSIIWAIRICRARNKNPWLAFFLLFPLTGPFVFLYLAFSNGEDEVEVGVPQLVTSHN